MLLSDTAECPQSPRQLLSSTVITFAFWSRLWYAASCTSNNTRLNAHPSRVSAEHPPDCILSSGNPRQRSYAEQGGPDPPPDERPHCEEDC